jgi:hypothetical protein
VGTRTGGLRYNPDRPFCLRLHRTRTSRRGGREAEGGGLLILLALSVLTLPPAFC